MEHGQKAGKRLALLAAGFGIILISGVAFVVYYSRSRNVRLAKAPTKVVEEIKDTIKWDSRTARYLSTLQPHIREKAVKMLTIARTNHSMDLRIIAGRRTCAEQSAIYAQGRTKPGKIVTKAKCGQSAHNYGLAIDVVEIKNRKALWINPNWDLIGTIGESVGFEWGGRWKSFKDRPHFQDLGGRSIASRYAAYQKTGKLT